VIDRWKLYYDQGPDFSSEDGAWSEAPADGVLFLVVWENGKQHVYSGADFYLNHEDTVRSTHDLGPWLRKLGLVKFGRWSSHRAMEAAAERVRRDA
jgi:hypothetical protein